jgi:4-hydroxy-tetrahydrodipicolinate synthase
MSATHPSGIICPIVTPLTADESLDVAAFRTLLDRVLPDIDGLLVLGTTGEFALLPQKVQWQIVEVAVARAKGEKPVYIGVGDTSTARVLEKLEFTNQSGADYVVVCSPYYYAFSDEDALAYHYFTIADQSDLPVLVYNIPQNTHNHLSPQLVRRLADHANIAGLKDSCGDMVQFQEFLSIKEDKGNAFSVFQGPEHLAAASLWLGADGVVSALANFVPELLQTLARQVRDSDREAALLTQRSITRLASIFRYGAVSSALKVVLNESGIASDRVASPLPPCSETEKQNIRSILREAALI